MAPRQECLFLEGQYVAVPIQGDILWRPDGRGSYPEEEQPIAPRWEGYELEEEHVVAPRWEGLNAMESNGGAQARGDESGWKIRLWHPD